MNHNASISLPSHHFQEANMLYGAVELKTKVKKVGRSILVATSLNRDEFDHLRLIPRIMSIR